jgi:hypothetical protein
MKYTKEEIEFRKKFCKKVGITLHQEEILCNIQRATYEKDNDFLSGLPVKVRTIAEECQDIFNANGDVDDEPLIDIIKRYYNGYGKLR